MKVLVWGFVFLLGCGYATPEQQIQRDLARHDPWVEDHFYATIDFWEPENFQKKYKKSCFSPAGNYAYLSDRITLHPPQGDRWEQSLGILDHELVHLLFDFQGKMRGPFQRGEVKGPAYTRRESYMQNRVKSHHFDPIRADIKKNHSGDCVHKWLRYLHDGEEVMARMVDSLYSLYFGPYDYKYFPLTIEDLAFLARYTYKGEPLFRKGIERYRIGMKMYEIGIAPSVIQHKLEFATEFKYKGKTFHWPKLERDFTQQITYQK